jgi:hypothetical protein
VTIRPANAARWRRVRRDIRGMGMELRGGLLVGIFCISSVSSQAVCRTLPAVPLIEVW